MNRLITLRPVHTDDEDFLFRLYASTREDELKALRGLNWDAGQIDAFLRMQFKAQAAAYSQQYGLSGSHIVLLNDDVMGRFYLYHSAEVIRVVDISLLPDYRNRGIGSSLLRGVLAEAEQNRLPVRLHVAAHNPAARLYARLGFRQVSDEGLYRELEWRPHS